MKQGWEIKKLGEVCDVIGGGTPSKKNSKFYEGDILWATVRDMKSEIISDTEFKITEGAVQKSSTKIIPKGNVIIATRVGLGKVCLIEKDTAINQDLRGIVPKDPKQLDNMFLFQWFKSISQLIVESGTGATVQGVKLPIIKDLPIPIPPLSEQQRIVSILDEAFAAIGRAKAIAEQNLNNTKELFETCLQGLFEKKGDGWEEKRFVEVCVLQRGFDLPTHSRFEGEHPLVSSNGITDNIDQWKVKAPGVVTGRSGTIGNVHFIEEDFWPLNTTLYIKDFHGNDERFIYYFLTAFNLSKYSSGAGVPTLNRNNVHSLKVCIPKSKSEQQAIVRQFDALRAETHKLEAVYQKKIADLEELKNSILQKAFAGELLGGTDTEQSKSAEPKTEKPQRDEKILIMNIPQPPNPEGVKSF